MITLPRGLAFGGGVMFLWKAWDDYFKLPSMDYCSTPDSTMWAEICRRGFSEVAENDMPLGKSRGQSTHKKLSDVINLADMVKSNHDAAYNNCINLVRYYELEAVSAEATESFFLMLPYLYILRTQKAGVSHSNVTRESEAASHYQSYTSDLCRSYMIRNGHLLSWATYVVKTITVDLESS